MIIIMLYSFIYIFFCQYNTGVDSETINVEVECLHNGYVTISWDYTPDIVESCQIEYLCYSDQIEIVCFYDASIPILLPIYNLHYPASGSSI